MSAMEMAEKFRRLTESARELLGDFKTIATKSERPEDRGDMSPLPTSATQRRPSDGFSSFPAAGTESLPGSVEPSPKALRSSGSPVKKFTLSPPLTSETRLGEPDMPPAANTQRVPHPLATPPATQSSLRAPAPMYTMSERSYLSFEATLSSLVQQVEEALAFVNALVIAETSGGNGGGGNVPSGGLSQSLISASVTSHPSNPGLILTPVEQGHNVRDKDAKSRKESVVRFQEQGGSNRRRKESADDGFSDDDADAPSAANTRDSQALTVIAVEAIGNDGNASSRRTTLSSEVSPQGSMRRVVPPPLTTLTPPPDQDRCTVGGLFSSPHETIDNDIAHSFSPVGSFRFGVPPALEPAGRGGSITSLQPANMKRSGSVMSVFSMDGEASPFSPHPAGQGPGGVRPDPTLVPAVDYVQQQNLSPPIRSRDNRRLSQDSISSNSPPGSRRESLGLSGSHLFGAASMSPHAPMEPFVLSPKGRLTNAMLETAITETMLAELAQRFPALVLKHGSEDPNAPTLSITQLVNAHGFSVIDFALHVFETYELAFASTAAPSINASVADFRRPESVEPDQPARSSSAAVLRKAFSAASLQSHGSMHSLRAAMALQGDGGSALSRTQTPNALSQDAPPVSTTPEPTNVTPPPTDPIPRTAPAKPQPAPLRKVSDIASLPPLSSADSTGAQNSMVSPTPAPGAHTKVGMTTVTYTLWQVFINAALSIFLQYRFAKDIGFDLVRFVHFLDAVFWLSSVKDAFHGALKTIDSLHAAHSCLSQAHVCKYLNDIDIFATLLAVLTMDVGHPGMTNEFLVRTNHPISNLFGVSSPLEAYSAAIVMTLLRDPRLNFINDSWWDDRPHASAFGQKTNAVVLKDLLSQLILATNPTAHLNVLVPLQALYRSTAPGGGGGVTASPRLNVPGGSGTNPRRRSGGSTGGLLSDSQGTESPSPGLFMNLSASMDLTNNTGEWLGMVRQIDIPLVLQGVVRLADAAYTLREVPIFCQWVDNIVVEYRRQHEEEERLGLRPSMLARIEPNPFEYQYRLMGMVIGPLVDALPIVPHEFRRCIKGNIKQCAEMTPDEARDMLPAMHGVVTNIDDATRLVISLLKQATPIAGALLMPRGLDGREGTASPPPPTTTRPVVAGSAVRAVEALQSPPRDTVVSLVDPVDLDAAATDRPAVPRQRQRSVGSFSVYSPSSAAHHVVTDADVSAPAMLAMLRLLTSHVGQLFSLWAAGAKLNRALHDTFGAELIRLANQQFPLYLFGSIPTGSPRSGSGQSSSQSTPGMAPILPRTYSVGSGSSAMHSTGSIILNSASDCHAIAHEILRHAELQGWYSNINGDASTAGPSVAPAFMVGAGSPNVCVAWMLKLWRTIMDSAIGLPLNNTSFRPQPPQQEPQRERAILEAVASTGAQQPVAHATAPQACLDAPEADVHGSANTLAPEPSPPGALLSAGDNTEAPSPTPVTLPPPAPHATGGLSIPERFELNGPGVPDVYKAPAPSGRAQLSPSNKKSPYTLGRR
jgi:hypothetical protein